MFTLIEYDYTYSIMPRAEDEKFFKDQVKGTQPPVFTRPKAAPDDRGVLAMVMATDKEKEVIFMRFPYPVTWLALDLNTALMLRAELDKRIKDLTS